METPGLGELASKLAQWNENTEVRLGQTKGEGRVIPVLAVEWPLGAPTPTAHGVRDSVPFQIPGTFPRYKSRFRAWGLIWNGWRILYELLVN